MLPSWTTGVAGWMALPSPRPGAPASPHPVRILLVDDDPDILESYGRLLERALPGASVTTASDPRAALSVLEAEGFDLIISDYRMPGMDGLEFLTHAHTICPEARRMLLSAYLDAGLEKRGGSSLSAESFVSKAAGIEALLGRVRSELAHTGS